jgi:anti-anti-sigma regulatory factor
MTYELFPSSQRLAMAVLLLDGGNDMFKISTIDTTGERRLVVEGTLVQPWVAELRRTWGDAANLLAGRQLVIDLSNATLIDSAGEDAIQELMKEGAKFCCSGVLTRHVLKQAARRCQTRLHKVLNRRHSKE